MYTDLDHKKWKLGVIMSRRDENDVPKSVNLEHLQASYVLRRICKLRTDDVTAAMDWPFRLLDLPPELQLQIISHVVVNEKPIDAVRLSCRMTWLFDMKNPPALAYVCRALRHDALNLYFEGNMFNCCHYGDVLAFNLLVEWLRRIAPEYRRHVKVEIEPAYWPRPYESTLDSLQRHFDKAGIHVRPVKQGDGKYPWQFTPESEAE
jgi:hypothetical protein